ncbi:hypothetical protein D3C86_1524670 [compost metagenome]
MKNDVGQPITFGTRLQAWLEFALTNQQQLDIVSSAALQFGGGIKHRIKSICQAVRPSKHRHQVSSLHLSRPPWRHFGSEDVQIASVRDQGDALPRNTSVSDPLHDAGRQPDQPVRRAVAGPLEHRHGTQHHWIANDPHRTR